MQWLKTAWAFAVRFAAVILLVAIAVRQLIIGDWFGAICLVVAAVVVLVIDLLKTP